MVREGEKSELQVTVGATPIVIYVHPTYKKKIEKNAIGEVLSIPPQAYVRGICLTLFLIATSYRFSPTYVNIKIGESKMSIHVHELE